MRPWPPVHRADDPPASISWPERRTVLAKAISEKTPRTRFPSMPLCRHSGSCSHQSEGDRRTGNSLWMGRRSSWYQPHRLGRELDRHRDYLLSTRSP